MSSARSSILISCTPPLSPLPASDVESIYYISLFQLAFPGKWRAQIGDWADNGGALPYITHMDHMIKSQHLFSLPGFQHPDEHSSPAERAEVSTWTAYIEGQITDLVYHSLYSLPENCPKTVGKAQLSDLTFPRSQYIPQRLRGVHKARLQYVGLWGLGGMQEGDMSEEDLKRLEELYVHAPGGTVAPKAWSGWNSGRQYEERRKKIAEDKLRNLISEAFAPIQRRLEKRPYIAGNRITTADLWLFANLSLVLTPTLPNPIFPDHLRTQFPSIIDHYQRVQQILFADPSSSAWSTIPTIPSPQPASLWDSLPTWSSVTSSFSSSSTSTGKPTGEAGPSSNRNGEKRKMTKAERDFRRGRWLWYAGAIGGMIFYVFASGLVQIQIADKTIGADLDEDGDDEDEEEEVVVVVEEEPDAEGNQHEEVAVSEEVAEDVARDLEGQSQTELPRGENDEAYERED